jgi:hypothetical protein
MAALFRLIAAMSRTQTTRLRESRAPVRQGAKIIDVNYEVVGRRTVWSQAVTVLTAVLWAAAIGFSVPQLWNFTTQVGAFFAQN